MWKNLPKPKMVWNVENQQVGVNSKRIAFKTYKVNGSENVKLSLMSFVSCVPGLWKYMSQQGPIIFFVIL